MKYIRTKDGKIKGFNTYRDDIDLVAYLSQFVNYQGKYAPIKQADTIEELCDEFVHGRMTFRTLKECLDYAPLGGEVYGAIWFKGEHNEPILKSIAKMNDKGELELL